MLCVAFSFCCILCVVVPARVVPWRFRCLLCVVCCLFFLLYIVCCCAGACGTLFRLQSSEEHEGRTIRFAVCLECTSRIRGPDKHCAFEAQLGGMVGTGDIAEDGVPSNSMPNFFEFVDYRFAK